ncbi:UDP-glucose 4-epimerase GalE [Pseudohalioglobus sediminis]|uniref:UDP-glucose 4-epimerase n=1 Tax=Pseudohalioglobus sediminis TaxID=2606449 RepID=A0A5B0WRQ5_9GAMM|nr:UDP-glucose 4-epimerase GalE [Pseudohalioglobus sediminis]KAA1188911.1 UDP-glucose 4-epimerase GalE [Pseudohalioglobus sediminis]
MSSTVLVTGGAGYIGSHACVSLISAGFTVVVLDNLCNASAEAVRRVEEISGAQVPLVRGDVRDAACLDALFAEHAIDAVMHFAGLKAVGESVEKPLEYYDNNVNGTLVLLAAMQRAQVSRIIFSSSATVYGDPASVPIREDFPTSATNPYGRSKLMVEEILGDWDAAHPEWSIGRLRYFNPVGAHSSGRIGEDPQGWPNNLMPFVAQVAVGRRDKLSVFGGDYPTPDGTGVRDYIHVMDLAEGHVAALRFILEQPGLLTVNLGTGKGASVLDMVRAFERASGRDIPYEIVERRAGDIAECWADPAMAQTLLGWQATRSLEEMCADTWRWQEANPQGYNS